MEVKQVYKLLSGVSESDGRKKEFFSHTLLHLQQEAGSVNTVCW